MEKPVGEVGGTGLSSSGQGAGRWAAFAGTRTALSAWLMGLWVQEGVGENY